MGLRASRVWLPLPIVVELSNGAEVVVRHDFAPQLIGPMAKWRNDYTDLDRGSGAVPTALLDEVHNLVVLPNVKALAAELALK